MIDFHNHVIPQIDDGAKTKEMALAMLRKAQEDGITCVVNTVHYQHPKMTDSNTEYNYILEQTEKLQKVLKENNIAINIISFSEVYFRHNLSGLVNNPLNIIKDKYMLIEFENYAFPEKYQETLFKLQTKGITPIIAHPERYAPIQRDNSILNDWIEKDYIIQITCGSITGNFGKKSYDTAHEMLKNGQCHLIGSDAHNDRGRNFKLKECLSIIQEKYGAENKSILLRNSENLLDGLPLKKTLKIKRNKSLIKKIKLWLN